MRVATGAGLILAAALSGCASAPGAIPVSARLAAWPVQEGFLAGAEGARLFYRKLGSGSETIIYLHGGPSTFRGSGDYMEPLATGRTLIMYDQRGVGRSELIRDPARLRVADHVRDIEAVRRHFGAPKVTLIGLSWGAGLAAHYAAQYPRRIDKLLLISPISPTKALYDARVAKLNAQLGPSLVARRSALRARLPKASDGEARSICREINDISFSLYFAYPTKEKFDHAGRRCDHPPAALRNRPLVDDAGFASLGNWDFRPMLAQIRAPALVVEGARSEVPLEATRLWAELMPNARYVLIPGAGHEFFMDQAQAWISLAERFLREPRRQTRPRQ